MFCTSEAAVDMGKLFLSVITKKIEEIAFSKPTRRHSSSERRRDSEVQLGILQLEMEEDVCRVVQRFAIGLVRSEGEWSSEKLRILVDSRATASQREVFFWKMSFPTFVLDWWLIGCQVFLITYHNTLSFSSETPQCARRKLGPSPRRNRNEPEGRSGSLDPVLIGFWYWVSSKWNVKRADSVFLQGMVHRDHQNFAEACESATDGSAAGTTTGSTAATAATRNWAIWFVGFGILNPQDSRSFHDSY